MDEERQDFEIFFSEKLREYSVPLKKLSELSGISIKYLECLRAGRYEQLPAAPYLHGYLVRLGQLLNFDGEEWWRRLKEEGLIRGSGPADQLPKNRFARRPITKKVWLGIIAAIILLYGGFSFSKISGTPLLVVTSPAEESTTVETDQFILNGRLTDGSRLTVNGEAISIGEDGSWQKRILLQPGLNSLRIVASKFLGREIEVIRQIIYQPPAPDIINGQVDQPTVTQ